MPAETVYEVLTRATHGARARGDANVYPAHLTLALLDCDAGDRLWQLLDVRAIKRDEMRLYVEAALEATAPKAEVADVIPTPVPALGPLLRDASRQAHDYDEADNQNALLLIALVAHRCENGEVLRSLGLDASEMRASLRHITRAADAGRNPLKLLDARAQSALAGAHQWMRATGCGRIGTAHLLLGVLNYGDDEALCAMSDNGVDLDELARLARAAIGNDGEIATAQIRLTRAAKRALDRARDVAPVRPRSIGVPALLWGLLPRSASWRERLTWGAPDDPLERVWDKVDVATVERVLSVMLGVVLAGFEPQIPTGMKTDWRALVAGAGWALVFGYLLTRGHDFAAPALFAGFGLALLIDWVGRWQKSYLLRAIALSFIVGCAVVIVTGALALAMFIA